MTISKRRLKDIKAIRDEDIDYSDIPELGDDFFRRADAWMPPEKTKGATDRPLQPMARMIYGISTPILHAGVAKSGYSH